MTVHPKRVRSQVGLDAIERVRSMLADFDEVEESVDKFGHTSFRVRDKPFVMLGEGSDGPSLSIKAELYTQRHLIEHRGFTRTRYIGQHGWASLPSLPPDDWAEIEELVVDGYLLVAPKRLMADLREERESNF